MIPMSRKPYTLFDIVCESGKAIKMEQGYNMMEHLCTMELPARLEDAFRQDFNYPVSSVGFNRPLASRVRTWVKDVDTWQVKLRYWWIGTSLYNLLNSPVTPEEQTI